MDLGLANRATVKAFILPASMLAGTDYDPAIDAIALGVARRVEKFCNRKFARLEDDEYQIDAARYHVSLPRYPLEAVDSIERQAPGSATWEADTALIEQTDKRAGLLHFATLGGSQLDRLRITYTGGYWYETLEPDDASFPTTQPTGSDTVPEDLALAWLLQIQHVWGQRDKLGTSLAEKPEAAAALASLALVPEVADMLRPFIRRSLT